MWSGPWQRYSRTCVSGSNRSIGVLRSLSGEGEDFISTWDEVHETFDVMGLHENLLRGIYAYGETLRVSFRDMMWQVVW